MHKTQGTFPVNELTDEQREALVSDCTTRGIGAELVEKASKTFVTFSGNSEQYDYARAAWRLAVATARGVDTSRGPSEGEVSEETTEE